MRQCREKGWRYILTHKDTHPPTAGEDYVLLDEPTKRQLKASERKTGRVPVLLLAHLRYPTTATPRQGSFASFSVQFL